MDENIETYVIGCNYCQSYKAFNRKAAVPIQAYGAPSMPWEVVHIDITGLTLPVTRKGNHYILVAKCALTRCVEVIPVKDKNEVTIARALIEHVLFKHGTPRIIVSDQGLEFVNKTTEQIAILLGITRIRTTAYNPRSNGLVENHNRTLKAMLAQYVDAYQSDWDQYLTMCAYQYNTTVNTQTGYTPFFMMYGRESRLVPEHWIERFAEERAMDTTSYAAKLIQILANAWRIAGSKKTEEVSRFNRVPITRLPFVEFEVGDSFYRTAQPAATYRHFTETGIASKDRKRMEEEEKKRLQQINQSGGTDVKKGKTGERPLSSNFQNRWVGPYIVSKKFSPVLYEAIINNEPTVVHAINMKHDQTIRNILPFVDIPESVITPIRETIPPYLRKNMNRYPEVLPLNIKLNDQVEQREITEEDADYNAERMSEKDMDFEGQGEEENKYEGYEEQEDEENDDEDE